MYTGSLGVFSNDADWSIPGSLTEDGEAVDLTAATFEFYVTKENDPRCTLLSATTADGKITNPTSTSFLIALTEDDVADLCAGTYGAFLKVEIGATRTQLVSGTLQVKEGGPKS